MTEDIAADEYSKGYAKGYTDGIKASRNALNELPLKPLPVHAEPKLSVAVEFGHGIEILGLQVRPYNLLKRNGIHTVRDLVARSEYSLLDIRNLGEKSIKEIKRRLELAGYSLADLPNAFTVLEE